MLNELFYALITFLDKGGIVLWAILALTLFLAWLLFERTLYLYLNAKNVEKSLKQTLYKNPSTYHHILLQKRVKSAFFKGFDLIKVTIALLPLFGLLGTVWGMIEVFDVMGTFGNSNPRLMASGVSKAIIPTMSGMAIAVLALLGFYFIKLQATRHMNRALKELNKVYNATL